MSKISRKRRELREKYDFSLEYSLVEAMNLIKESDYRKIKSSVDVAISLNVDVKKTDQIVRGSVVLPHGTGAEVSVLVICGPDKEAEAKTAGADFVGGEEFIDKLASGWMEAQSIVIVPSMMALLARKAGKVLGQKGLMPNPKNGTVTDDIVRAVSEIKAGKVDFKTDKYGIIHARIGKIFFLQEHLVDNFNDFLSHVIKLKPSSAKVPYIKNIHLSSTMGEGIKIDKSVFMK